MNITLEDKGNLTSLIKVEITPEDYQEEVTKQLKEQQKNAHVKGFRKGKVPYGLIEKWYGRSIRLDQINKILSEKLTNYIQENELPVLGQPMPSQDHSPEGDFDKNDNFVFYFDIGLSPEINLNLPERDFDYYRIKLDKKQIDEHIENIRKQYGEQQSVEEPVEDKDVLKGAMKELDEEGNPVEEGIVNEQATLSMEYVQDEDIKNEILGKEIGDQVTINPMKVSGNNESEAASMLNVDKERAGELDKDFQFTINEITRVAPAELNEELFKKVYPKDEITTEEDFRKKVAEEAEKAYEKESDKMMMAQATDKLVDELDPELPDEFLKRWLVENEKNLTREQIENDYERYAKSMKWQLIENKILKEYSIEVKDEEVKDQIRSYFLNQIGGENASEEMKQQIEPIVASMMQNDDQTKQIYDQLYDEKMARVIKEHAQINEKEVTYDQFVKMAQEQNQKHEQAQTQQSEPEEAQEEEAGQQKEE
ncbi:MAG: trigger factor [Bacteroidales bacterium]|nr:trigger factor [Bacteroidales bacterium]MCF8334331.1 trigger factor [Bacteroidales bacterium]